MQEALIKLAFDCGFSHVGMLDPSTIRVRAEVREACAQNKCNAYAKNWACPPACGTLEDCGHRISGYKSGIIVQTSVVLEDEFDYDGMQKAGREHSAHLDAFADKMRELHPYSLILGAGACRRCESCTYPAKPCRHPKKMITSMEAFGMVVSDVCKDNTIPYYYGAGTLTYVGCALF